MIFFKKKIEIVNYCIKLYYIFKVYMRGGQYEIYKNIINIIINFIF